MYASEKQNVENREPRNCRCITLISIAYGFRTNIEEKVNNKYGDKWQIGPKPAWFYYRQAVPY